MSKTKKWKWTIVVSSIIVIVVLFVITTAKKNTAYYVTPSEIYASPAKYDNRNLRVMGFVIPKSVVWDPATLNLHFVVTDSKKNITVDYAGVKPDMFKEGQGVIAVGMLESYHIQATKLLVKHTAEYRAKHAHILSPIQKKLDSP